MWLMEEIPVLSWPTLFQTIHLHYKSSLGFYKTLGTYIGKHGYSLRLRVLKEVLMTMQKKGLL